MNQKAFLIRSGMDGITSRFYEKSIGIFGRSVYDIHIGDLLIYQGMQYLVISIKAYRKKLEELGLGITICKDILKGNWTVLSCSKGGFDYGRYEISYL